MEVRKHNARKITETFEYNTRVEMDVKEVEAARPIDFYSGKLNMPVLKGFKIAGEDGKISLTFDERDKQQVVDLLRAMADSLDGRVTPRGNTEKGTASNAKLCTRS